VAVIMPLIFFIGVQMFAGFTFLPVYFQSVMMDTALMSGVKLFPLVFTFLFGAGVASAIMQKTGRIGYLIPMGAVMLTMGLGLLSLVQPDTNFGVVAGFMLLFGLGIGIIFALVSVTLQNSVSADQMGVVMSAFAFFQLLGGSLGVAIVGALMNHWTATYFMEYPTNPLLALCSALDNVFIATIFPGVMVCFLSIFIQGIKLEPHKKHVDDMEAVEKGTDPAPTSSEETAPTEKLKQVEAVVIVEKDPQVEQALAEARAVIERKKSKIIALQEAQEAREQQERESYREAQESQQEQPREETEEEMEKRVREKQLFVERERELEAQRQRESQVLERAALAMDVA